MAPLHNQHNNCKACYWTAMQTIWKRPFLVCGPKNKHCQTMHNNQTMIKSVLPSTTWCIAEYIQHLYARTTSENQSTCINHDECEMIQVIIQIFESLNTLIYIPTVLGMQQLWGAIEVSNTSLDVGSIRALGRAIKVTSSDAFWHWWCRHKLWWS